MSARYGESEQRFRTLNDLLPALVTHPAMTLYLMNDPFVVGEAQRWARVMHDMDASKMKNEETKRP